MTLFSCGACGRRFSVACDRDEDPEHCPFCGTLGSRSDENATTGEVSEYDWGDAKRQSYVKG